MARVNPVTYVIEGVRALVLSNWGNPAIWQGFLVTSAMFVVLVSLTVSSFQKALR